MTSAYNILILVFLFGIRGGSKHTGGEIALAVEAGATFGSELVGVSKFSHGTNCQSILFNSLDLSICNFKS